MPNAIITGQTGGGLQRGFIVNEYKVAAGNNVGAKGFVEFLARQIESGIDTALSSVNSTGVNTASVLLPNGDIFVAHMDSLSYLRAMVVTVSGTTITAGEDTILSMLSNAGQSISAVLLPNGKVFVAHRGEYSAALYGMVVTISGTTITAGTDTMLTGYTSTGVTISAVALPNGNVFIAHSDYRSVSVALYGMVVTISGTTITAGTDTAIVNVEKAAQTISTTLLPSGKILITHSLYSLGTYLYGVVVTISGTTITVGTDTLISGVEQAGGAISNVLLPNGKVFIAHRYGGSTSSLYGMVVTISGTTITAGTDIELSPEQASGTYVRATLLSDGSVFIAHSRVGLSLYGMAVSGDGEIIGADTPLIDTDNAWPGASLVSLSNASVFVAHRGGSTQFLYAVISTFADSKIQPYNDQLAPHYYGIAKTAGTGGDTIKVYEPNI